MKISTGITLYCACCLSLASLTFAQQRKNEKAQSFNTSGIYSDITVGESGDYGGIEIYLTDSDGQFYVTVTIAEGVLLPPVLVKAQVQVEARKIAFTLPGAGGARKFTGTVSAGGLTLFENKERRFLKRKCYK